MNHGPLPTRIVFLSDLAATAPGTKVRFLGCVTEYSPSTGFLTLRHAYPPPPSPCSAAVVDVNVILESLKSTDTKVGEWVNVMGYIEASPKNHHRRENIYGRDAHKDQKEEDGKGDLAVAKVQAVMLWSAGGVKLDGYERDLAARIRIGKDKAETDAAKS